MDETLNQYFNLTFTTTHSRTKVLRINYPNLELTASQVRTAANKIMTGNIFDREKTGGLTGIKKMEKISVTRTTVI